jgi:hypothetical protein
MRKDKRLTSSDTRQERIKGNAGGSQPRPRPTQVSTTKQQGPLRPKTVTESNRAQSPRLPKLPKNPVRKPTGNTAMTRRPMSPAAMPKPMAMRGAGRMGGPVAGTLLAAATPGVRKLGTAMGTKLGVALRPVGRAIDRTFGTKPKKKKAK